MPKPPRPRPPRKTRLPHVLTPPPQHGKARASTSVQLPGRGSQHEIDMGAAVAEALFGTPRRPLTRVIREQGEAMEPVVGSVLHFTPANSGWLANFVDDENNVWQEPVIGWACVVVWAAYAGENEDVETKGTKQFQTELQPVTLLEDGALEPLVMRDGITLTGFVMPGMVLMARTGETSG